MTEPGEDNGPRNKPALTPEAHQQRTRTEQERETNRGFSSGHLVRPLENAEKAKNRPQEAPKGGQTGASIPPGPAGATEAPQGLF